MHIDVECQKKLQNDLLRWLNAVGSASWKEINQALIGMMLSCGLVKNAEESKYPAYKLFEPLLRNGVIEAFRDKQVKFYPIFKDLDGVAVDKSLSSLSLLKKIHSEIHSIRSLVMKFEKLNIDLDDFMLLNLDVYPNEFLPIVKKTQQKSVGIYSRKGYSWESKFIYDGSVARLIPSADENPDSFNVARCFVRLNWNRKLFCYHSQSKTLEIYHYEEHPVLVTRALFLSESSQIHDINYYRPIGSWDNKICYNNVTSQHVAELRHIYNFNAIEEKND